MELRSELAISHAFRGFDMDEQEALDLLKNSDEDMLTKEEKSKRDRLVAAVRNLIDFAVCEEYQLYRKVQNRYDEFDEAIDYDEYPSEFLDECDEWCKTYNDTYATVENHDIEYAMGIALAWVGYGDEVYLTYMTQNDDRVRPWHYALQGETYTKDDFPAWMIPPIEWACRCFLVPSYDGNASKNVNRVMAKKTSKPKQLDGIFSESVAKCGRIFSSSHPYFNVRKEDKSKLKEISNNLKGKYNV
jgi:SPP1 gp7 family putative phage head morphogenesis protein